MTDDVHDFLNLKLRPLGWTDAVFCWNLATEVGVRLASVNRQRPTLRAHTKWMRDWICDLDKRAWVVLYNGERVGLGRLQRGSGCVVIGIALTESARGLGIGTKAIKAVTGEAWYFLTLKVEAHIREENEASKRAFAKAGYSRAAVRTREGIEIWTMTL